MISKKQSILRMLIGGSIAVAVNILAAFLIAGVSLYGDSSTFSHMQLSGDAAFMFYGSRAVADVVQLAAMFGLGAAIGLSTLPFAETWTKLLPLSILHFAVTGVLAVLAFWPYLTISAILLLYVAIYLLIWLIRWLLWYMELKTIRARLGLNQKKGDSREKSDKAV